MNNLPDLSKLEPGCDENPMEYDPQTTYNPLNYAYPMLIDTDTGKVEIMVRFLVGEANAGYNPICFSHQGKDYEIANFFPVQPENGLEPIQIPGIIGKSGYQIGENPYTIVPAIVRARRIHGNEWIPGAEEGGDLISRDECKQLVSPDLLLDRLRKYRDEVLANPQAPLALVDILNHFCEDSCTAGSAAWNSDSDEDDDEYFDEEENEEDWDEEDWDDEDEDDWGEDDE